jgi:hypothetical protein
VSTTHCLLHIVYCPLSAVHCPLSTTLTESVSTE